MIYVIDDFYDNVDEVINLANTLTYRSDVCGEHFLRTYGLPCRNVGEIIERLLNIEVDWDDMGGKSPAGSYENMNGSFYKPRTEPGFISDHLHHDWYDWGGIVYLNNDLPTTFGTQFWRVAETKEYIAYTPSGNYDERCNRENSKNGMFEKTDYISNKFNRLLLFKGKYFHSAVIPDSRVGLKRLCQFWQINGKNQIDGSGSSNLWESTISTEHRYER